MAQDNSTDPKAHELIVTLHEDDQLVYEAECGLPDGFKIPATGGVAAVAAVPMITRRVQSKFAGIPRGLGDAGGNVVAAVKLVWDFIEAGKPKATAEGASTAVLAGADMAWDHYAGGEQFTSPTYTYRVENLIGVQVVKVEYVARGSCKAGYDGPSKNVHDGAYMPNVEVFCSKIEVGFGWTLNAKAVLSQITNVGPKGGLVIPEFYATLSFTLSSWCDNSTQTFSYRLRGDTGFVAKA